MFWLRDQGDDLCTWACTESRHQFEISIILHIQEDYQISGVATYPPTLPRLVQWVGFAEILSLGIDGHGMGVFRRGAGGDPLQSPQNFAILPRRRFD